MPKQCNLIFDFDGTLVDSFSTSIQKLNDLAEEFNFHKVPIDDIESLKNLSSKELISYLKIPFFKLPRVIQRAKEIMHKEVTLLSAFAGMSEVLQQLHEHCSLSILTSNSHDSVILWLERHKLRHLFDFIEGDCSYFGKAKMLKNILKSNHLELSNTLYIGDETRDIEAAIQCKIRSIAVTWGFSSQESLERAKPNYIANTPNDLLEIHRFR